MFIIVFNSLFSDSSSYFLYIRNICCHLSADKAAVHQNEERHYGSVLENPKQDLICLKPIYIGEYDCQIEAEGLDTSCNIH